MANLKFSGFTAAAAIDQTDSFLVGFDTDGGGANPTNNKWTFPEVAAGLPTFYAGDGTLSAARTLSMDGNDLTFDGGAAVYPTFNIGDITLYPNGQNNSAYPSKNSMQVRGLIRFPYYGAASPGLSWESYNTTVKAYGFSMYGGGGWTHNSGYSVIGPNFAWDSGNDLTARLGVIGVHTFDTVGVYDYICSVGNHADQGMVATSHPIAVGVGLDILKKGGNAVDAAIAMALVLPLCEPHSTGLFGDVFALIKPMNSKKIIGLNGSGPAPKALNSDSLRERGHLIVPEDSIESVTLPGAVKAFDSLNEKFGRMDLMELCAPAIEYAEKGIIISPRVAFDCFHSSKNIKGIATRS